MSGRRIDDHASFAGKGGKMVLPEGNKIKQYKSADGSGHIGTMYPDTSEKIMEDQKKGDAKAKAHAIKPGYRN
jgi:hypothetical protein